MDPTGFSKNGEPKSEKRMGVVKKATRPLKNSNDINYVTKILIGQSEISQSKKISPAECPGVNLSLYFDV